MVPEMRLKPSQVKETRLALIDLHQGLCELCENPIQDPCLDHDHKTGAIRGSICRSCNSALGSLERTPRYGIKNVLAFVKGAAKYLERHQVNMTGLEHPSHLSPLEKKVKAKARALRKKRNAKVRP